jgi:hypothetical protein
MKNKIGILGYVLATAIAPLIIFGKKIILENDSKRAMTYITYDGYQVDFVSYYKSVILIAGAIILMLSMAGKIDLKKECIGIKSKYYIMGVILLAFIVVSFIFSMDREISLLGISGRFEGFLAEISYMVIFLTGLSFLKNRNSREKILKIIIGFSGVMFLIGIFQFFGFNILETDFMSNVMTGFDVEKFGGLKYSFGKYASYGTLSNPNYMGSYSIMLFFLGLGFYLSSVKKRKRVFFLGYTGLAFANLIGCHSRAGFLGFQAGVILFIISMNREIQINWKKILVLVSMCILIWSGMDVFSQKALGKKLGNISKGVKTEVYGIEAEGNQVRIDGVSSLKIKGSSEGLEFYDEIDGKIPVTEKDRLITLDKPGYEKYYLKKHKSIKDFYLLGNGENFNYQLYFIEGKFYTIDHMDKITEIPPVKRIKFFDGYEKKGSSRIYIWSRTIPKIFEKPIFGHGQDTFPLVFPQNDFFGKKLSFGMKGIFVDKPHNYFIQIALNNGIPALILVGFLFLSYFYDSLKKIILKKDVFSICIFLSVFSYFITCFFNDSVVSVAPLFWTLLAIGISLNEESEKSEI